MSKNTVMPELQSLFEGIDQEKAKIDAARPLPAESVASLREHLALDWTYNSNAIEGNTLTLRETKVVLEGTTVGGKTLREHLEAINHNEAIGYVQEIVDKTEPLSEWSIRSIHGLVLKGIDNDNAGSYRRVNVLISGATSIPPDVALVPQEMSALMDWYGKAGDIHPVERAAQLHTRFVKVHPFIDGNGRTARLLMNLELMKNGYPPAVIRKEDRRDYYDVLDEASTTGNYTGITRLVAESVKRSMDLYTHILGPEINKEMTPGVSQTDQQPIHNAHMAAQSVLGQLGAGGREALKAAGQGEALTDEQRQRLANAWNGPLIDADDNLNDLGVTAYRAYTKEEPAPKRELKREQERGTSGRDVQDVPLPTPIRKDDVER